jgi:hypothetical protein
VTPRGGRTCTICGYPVSDVTSELCGQCAEWQGIAIAADTAIKFNEQRADRVAPEQRFPCRLPRRSATGAQEGSAVKAIETEYKGYRFRSRLEARWAVFMDELDVDWQYEPEGFDTSAGRYLPDFFLKFRADVPDATRYPGAGYWLEVKPVPPQADEVAKMMAVCAGTNHSGYIVAGTPWEYRRWAIHWSGRVSEGMGNPPGHPLTELDMDIHWGRFSRVSDNPFYASTTRPAMRSRGARFEHGEKGGAT